MSEGFVVTMAPAKNSWPKKLNFCEKMFDYEEVMSQTDSESNETSCDESSVEERINVGIVESYANEPFITFKDGAYYCYCAYVLSISRYSDFPSPILTNTGIFLRGLKLSG